jgi:peroxiredoxin
MTHSFLTPRTKFLLLILAAFLFMAAAAYLFLPKLIGKSGSNPGRPAPDFSLTTASGEEVTLETFRGKVIVFNLWASWCSPCREEMPGLEAVYQLYKSEDFIVLGVNQTYNDVQDSAMHFIEQTGVTFPILFDASGDGSKQYQLQMLPVTYVIDKKGTIRDTIIGGPLDAQEIAYQVASLLEEK